MLTGRCNSLFRAGFSYAEAVITADDYFVPGVVSPRELDRALGRGLRW